MALELNGTTGVSLVQDGVVTAGDLASTLDLTGKTVTLPAGVGGKVVKLSAYQKSANTQTTSSSLVDVWSETYTPVASGNLIVVSFSAEIHSYRSGGADGRYYYKVVIDGTNYPRSDSTGTEIGPYDYGSSGPWLNTRQHFQYYYTLTSSSAITIKLQLGTGGQASAVTLNVNGSSGTNNLLSTLTVMEIAA